MRLLLASGSPSPPPFLHTCGVVGVSCIWPLFYLPDDFFGDGNKKDLNNCTSQKYSKCVLIKNLLTEVNEEYFKLFVTAFICVDERV